MTAAIIIGLIILGVIFISPVIVAVSDDITFRKALKGDEKARRRIDAELMSLPNDHTK